MTNDPPMTKESPITNDEAIDETAFGYSPSSHEFSATAT
jgi:hypothetical protein